MTARRPSSFARQIIGALLLAAMTLAAYSPVFSA
jgi:hypothetical protein